MVSSLRSRLDEATSRADAAEASLATHSQAALQQKVSSLQAALRKSKQKEAVTTQRLCKCEQQLRQEKSLLEVAIKDSLREVHETEAQHKQVIYLI